MVEIAADFEERLRNLNQTIEEVKDQTDNMVEQEIQDLKRENEASDKCISRY
jgi:regulator of replication initiation timing